MFPYFTLFGNTYHLYALIGLAAIFTGAAAAAFRAKNYGLSRQDMIFTAAFAGIGLVIGGSFLFAIVQIPRLINNFGYFLGYFPQSLGWVFGGMVFYGGLFGSIAGVYFSARLFKLNFRNLLYLIIPVLPLAHGIMRVGCFMAGCCHGIEHETFGISFSRSLAAPNGVPLVPVQLYESFANVLLFVFLWIYTKKRREILYPLCVYGLSYAAARFALEFLRGDAGRGFVLGLSTSQIISVLIIAACISSLLYRRLRCQNVKNKTA